MLDERDVMSKNMTPHREKSPILLRKNDTYLNYIESGMTPTNTARGGARYSSEVNAGPVKAKSRHDNIKCDKIW